MRKRSGKRTWSAEFEQHNGNRDQTGNPTYSVPGDWAIAIANWPCELVTTQGGETVRGRQVTAQTTHVLFGEYYGAVGAIPAMRVTVSNQKLQVVSVYDPDGMNREMRVEAKVEM